MQGGWSKENCPLKIFAMSNVAPLGRAKAGVALSSTTAVAGIDTGKPWRKLLFEGSKYLTSTLEEHRRTLF